MGVFKQKVEKFHRILQNSVLQCVVAWINGYSEEDIWDLDKKFVSGQRTDGKVSKGRADLFAGQIRQEKLDVKAEPTPHKDHANIEGYSNDKSANMLKAIELANQATLVLQDD